MASAGGLFRIDHRNAEIKTLSKLDGFQASGISTMRYAAELKILIIGYENGMIELLKNDQELSPITGLYKPLPILPYPATKPY